MLFSQEAAEDTEALRREIQNPISADQCALVVKEVSGMNFAPLRSTSHLGVSNKTPSVLIRVHQW